MVVALGATSGCVIGDIFIFVRYLFIMSHRWSWAVIVHGGTNTLVVVSPRVQTFWEIPMWACEFQIRRLLLRLNFLVLERVHTFLGLAVWEVLDVSKGYPVTKIWTGRAGIIVQA